MGKTTSFVLACLLFVASGGHAETDFTFSGQLRMKNYVDDMNFFEDGGTYYFNYFRTRVGLSATVDSAATAFVQFQDSRSFHFGPDDESISGSELNLKNVDLHQAFLRVNRFVIDSLSIAGGRFELSHGNERILGSNDWDEVARAWQGVQAWYRFRSLSFNFFLVAGPVTPGEGGYETDISGYRVTTGRPNLDLLLLFENLDGSSERYPFDRHRYTWAAYGKHSVGLLRAEWNAAYQSGDASYTFSPTTQAKFELSAYLLTLELGVEPPSPIRSFVAVGIDYSSGDNDHDSTLESFESPYFSDHNFHGYMDHYYLTWFDGLIDVYGRGRVEPANGWVVEAWLHRFSTEYSRPYWEDGLIKDSKELGWELDITFETDRIKGITLEGGLGIFFPPEPISSYRDSQNGRLAYVLTTLNF